MTLTKRANSRFWYVQFQFDHQTVIRSTRTTDRKIAEQVAARIRAEIHAEVMLGRRRPITLEQALERFTDAKVGSANHRNIVSQMRIILRTLDGSTPAARITNSMLEEFRRRRAAAGCGGQTIKHGLSCLVSAIRLAREDGYDAPELKPPSVKVPNGRLRYLTVDEERRLLSELDPKREANGMVPYARRSFEKKAWMQDNYDLVILLLDTGARYSEVANIGWNQIDVAARSIRLWRPKVQNESILFMTTRVFDVLSRRAESKRSEFVFSSKAGGPRGYSAIAIRKAIRRAGLVDCTIHTLRHTHASRLIQNGLNVYEVRTILGHTDIRTTMRYAHLEQADVASRARDVIDRICEQA